MNNEMQTSDKVIILINKNVNICILRNLIILNNLLTEIQK